MKNLIMPLSVAFSLIIGGCTWVKVSDAGKDVVILPADRVANCARVGNVTTSVKDRVAGIERNEEKVQRELDRLAQNQAVTLNANSLVRVSIRDGQGNYLAYRCP